MSHLLTTTVPERRAVILSAPVALWGQALFGKVPELPAPAWLVGRLPSRLEMMHVEATIDCSLSSGRWLGRGAVRRRCLARSLSSRSDS